MEAHACVVVCQSSSRVTPSPEHQDLQSQHRLHAYPIEHTEDGVGSNSAGGVWCLVVWQACGGI